MEPMPTTIGRYVVEALIGSGGMGRIYKAHDPDIRRPVAIKLIQTSLMAGADRADYIRRFRREAEAAARCAHPNIVTIYDFALHEGEPFLAMEFVEGQSVRDMLDATPVMSVPEAVRIMLQVLDALSSAHAQGVIHQDIKPANIMLTPDWRVKVGDFGISRLSNVESTAAFFTVGTPAYMSPEQCRGEEVDGRSDLFSAGATLFEMVAGERAFPGRNAIEISQRILNERLPMVPAAVRAAAPRLQLVLERAMAKQREDRFDTGADMAEALRQVLVRGMEEADDHTRLAPAAGRVAGGPLPPALRQDPVSTSQSSGLQSSGLALDGDLMRRVEDKLKPYVGPIARVLLRTAAGRSRTTDELLGELMHSIQDEGERAQFRREVEPLMRPSWPAAGSSSPTLASSPGDSHARGGILPEPELERAQTALAGIIGPIARVLVRRAAARAPTVEALWQALASHIDSPAERAAFLRQREK